ncbi:MAG: regulatory protein RecX [Spirochaetales bacterium]|nr:regulatory protein RecX [Spirochaetales bacterium]
MHEDGSSSQRDNLTIIRIKQAKKTKSSITLSDESSVAVLQEIIDINHISEGMNLSRDEIEGLVVQSLSLEAERYALTLLSRMLYSTFTLTLKLKKKGYAIHIIEKVIPRLEELGYLDDIEFAKAWVWSRLKRRPESRNALFSGLRKKGIDSSIAEYVLEESFPEEKEKENALLLLQRLKDTGRSEENIMKTLFSRGFSMKTIREVLKERE